MDDNQLTPAQTRRWIRWVKALESGEYKRASEKLCDLNGKMCCLGVAYDLEYDADWVRYDRTWVIENDDIDQNALLDGEYKVGVAETTVGENLKKLFGFTRSTGFETKEKGWFDFSYKDIAAINDESTREDYADVIPHIEEYLLKHGDQTVLAKSVKYRDRVSKEGV